MLDLLFSCVGLPLLATDAELVGVWVGIIAGIAGTVLAIVAISFTFHVDDRAKAVNDQMIQSLQKIDSSVESVATSTEQLIKVAWDRMFGGTGPPGAFVAPPAPTNDLAGGITAEVKAELSENPERHLTSAELGEKLDEIAASIDKALAMSRSDRPSSVFDSVVRSLGRMDATGRELARVIRAGHLSRSVYRKLMQSPTVGPALMQLREEGIIAPLKGHEAGKEVPVYWFPSSIAGILGAALRGSGPDSPEARESVIRELERAGYDAHERNPYEIERP